MKTVRSWINNNFESILYTLLAGEITLLALASIKRPFFPDEIECLKSAWFVSLGDIPYVDFFQHHHPFFYYVLAPLFWMVKAPINACIPARLVALLFFLGTMAAVYNIGALVYDKTTGLLATLIVPSWVAAIRTAFEIRPDTPEVCCGVWSVYFLFYGLQTQHTLPIIISGLFWAFSYLFLQKASLLGIALLLILLTESFFYKKSLFNVAYFLLGALIPLACYYFYLIINNQFIIYWNYCHLFNQRVFEGGIYNLLTPTGFLRNFITMAFWLGFFVDDRIHWTFFFIGLFATYITKETLYLSVCTLIGLSWAFICPSGYQYHVWYIPFASILVGAGLKILFNKQSESLLISLFFLLWLILSHSFVLIDSNKKQFNEAKKLEQALSKKDPIILDNQSLLFYPRTHPGWVFIDFIQGKVDLANENYTYSKWLAEIEKKKPTYIHEMHTNGLIKDAPFFKNNYTKLDEFPLYILKEKLPQLH